MFSLLLQLSWQHFSISQLLPTHEALKLGAVNISGLAQDFLWDTLRQTLFYLFISFLTQLNIYNAVLNFKLPLDAYSSLGVTKQLIWQLHSRCRPKGNLSLQRDWNQHSSLWQPNVLIITMETPTVPGETGTVGVSLFLFLFPFLISVFYFLFYGFLCICTVLHYLFMFRQ